MSMIKNRNADKKTINGKNINNENIDTENIDTENKKENETMNSNLSEIKNENNSESIDIENIENDNKKKNETMNSNPNLSEIKSENININADDIDDIDDLENINTDADDLDGPDDLDDANEIEFVRVYEFMSSLNLISVKNNSTLSLINDFDSAQLQSIIKDIDKSFRIQTSTDKIDYAFISDVNVVNDQYVIHWTCYGHPNRDDSTVDDARQFILNNLIKLVPQFMSKPICSFLTDPETETEAKAETETGEANETEKIQGNIICVKEDIYINFGMTLVHQSED